MLCIYWLNLCYKCLPWSIWRPSLTEFHNRSLTYFVECTHWLYPGFLFVIRNHQSAFRQEVGWNAPNWNSFDVDLNGPPRSSHKFLYKAPDLNTNKRAMRWNPNGSFFASNNDTKHYVPLCVAIVRRRQYKNSIHFQWCHIRRSLIYDYS